MTLTIAIRIDPYYGRLLRDSEELEDAQSVAALDHFRRRYTCGDHLRIDCWTPYVRRPDRMQDIRLRKRRKLIDTNCCVRNRHTHFRRAEMRLVS